MRGMDALSSPSRNVNHLTRGDKENQEDELSSDREKELRSLDNNGDNDSSDCSSSSSSSISSSINDSHCEFRQRSKLSHNWSDDSDRYYVDREYLDGSIDSLDSPLRTYSSTSTTSSSALQDQIHADLFDLEKGIGGSFGDNQEEYFGFEEEEDDNDKEEKYQDHQDFSYLHNDLEDLTYYSYSINTTDYGYDDYNKKDELDGMPMQQNRGEEGDGKRGGGRRSLLRPTKSIDSFYGKDEEIKEALHDARDAAHKLEDYLQQPLRKGGDTIEDFDNSAAYELDHLRDYEEELHRELDALEGEDEAARYKHIFGESMTMDDQDDDDDDPDMHKKNQEPFDAHKDEEEEEAEVPADFSAGKLKTTRRRGNASFQQLLSMRTIRNCDRYLEQDLDTMQEEDDDATAAATAVTDGSNTGTSQQNPRRSVSSSDDDDNSTMKEEGCDGTTVATEVSADDSSNENDTSQQDKETVEVPPTPSSTLASDELNTDDAEEEGKYRNKEIAELSTTIEEEISMLKELASKRTTRRAAREEDKDQTAKYEFEHLHEFEDEITRELEQLEHEDDRARYKHMFGESMAVEEGEQDQQVDVSSSNYSTRARETPRLPRESRLDTEMPTESTAQAATVLSAPSSICSSPREKQSSVSLEKLEQALSALEDDLASSSTSSTLVAGWKTPPRPAQLSPIQGLSTKPQHSLRSRRRDMPIDTGSSNISSNELAASEVQLALRTALKSNIKKNLTTSPVRSSSLMSGTVLDTDDNKGSELLDPESLVENTNRAAVVVIDQRIQPQPSSSRTGPAPRRDMTLIVRIARFLYGRSQPLATNRWFASLLNHTTLTMVLVVIIVGSKAYTDHLEET